MIPYGKQWLNKQDIDAVTAVLQSDWLTQGPAVAAFENAVSQYCGTRFAVAVNSGTSALHLACLAIGLGPGDILWTSPNTFVASANCGLYCGAEVDFVDIDPATLNMSTDALATKLEAAEAAGRLPKVVVPVHFGGHSCDLRNIRALGNRYGFRIIEDACHAIGGSYLDTPIGSCRYSEITVFSFHPVKIVTAGEGGMALTNSPELTSRMARLRTHGITRNTREMAGETHGDWYYEQVDLGFNYRMTDIHAALGASQMKRLDEFVARRRELAARYDQLLEGFPVRLQEQASYCSPAWHLYVIRLRLDEIKTTRREVFDAMRAAGIGVNVHYIPVHAQPHYRKLGFRDGMFHESERYYLEALTLPIFAGMTDTQQDSVVSALAKALQ